MCCKGSAIPRTVYGFTIWLNSINNLTHSLSVWRLICISIDLLVGTYALKVEKCTMIIFLSNKPHVTWSKYCVPIRPANQLSHTQQNCVFHQCKYWGNFIREPVMECYVSDSQSICILKVLFKLEGKCLRPFLKYTKHVISISWIHTQPQTIS